MSEFVRGRHAYWSFVFALVRPGRTPYIIKELDQSQLGSLEGWQPEDVDLLLEEGRRVADSEAQRLDALRARAQVAFTLALVLLGATGAQLVTSGGRPSNTMLALISLGALLTFIGTLGALALLVVQVAAPAIHPLVMTDRPPNSRQLLATDYAENAGDWFRLNGTILNILRESVLYMTLGAGLAGVVWLVHHA